MGTAFLALESKQGTQPRVKRYINATPVGDVGAAFGPAGGEVVRSGGNNEPTLNHGRVVRFKGSNDLFTLVKNDVYRFNGTSWSSVHTISPLTDSSGDGCKVGPYVMFVNGVPTLVALTRVTPVSGTDWIAIRSTDGTTWSSTTFTSGTEGYYDTVMSVVVWNNVLYWTATDSGNAGFLRLLSYNPTTNTFATYAAPASVQDWHQTPALVVLNNRLFTVRIGDFTDPGNRKLYEFTGTSWTLIVSVYDPGSGNLVNTNSKGCLFTDGTKLFHVFYDSTPSGAESTGGIHCWEIDIAGPTVTDRTTTTIPTSIRTGQGAGTVAKRGTRVAVLYDHEANPGGVPDIYLYVNQGNAATGTWSMYKWNGVAALIGNAGVADDVNGEVAHAIPWGSIVSGKHFWTPDQFDISVESIARAVGGELITFKIYKSPSPESSLKVRFYFGTDGEFETQAAALSSPSEGTLSGGNEIQGLTTDNGAVSKTVRWLSETDGVETGDRVRLTARLFQ
jgi:hypothetical protein